MKVICVAALFAALSLSAQAGKCTDPGLVFTISSSYADPMTGTPYSAGLISDGQGPYVNGLNGVNASLQICNGSDGATLSPGSVRSVLLWLANVVAGTSATPAWTASQAPVLFFTIPFGNNVTNTAGDYYFATYLKVTMASPNTGYYFDMENPSAKTPFNAPASGLNTPCATATVNVHHIPAQPGVSAETWIVWPDAAPASCSGTASGTQVGTLLGPPPRGNTPVNVGQFSVPFYISIQRQ